MEMSREERERERVKEKNFVVGDRTPGGIIFFPASSPLLPHSPP
jgi:hypothetical protein